MSRLLDNVQFLCAHLADEPDHLWGCLVHDNFGDIAVLPDDYEVALARAERALANYPDEERHLEIGRACRPPERFHPGLSLLRSLTLVGDFSTEDTRRLIADPGLAAIQALVVDDDNLNDERLGLLLSAPATAHIQITLKNTNITDAGIQCLVSSSRFRTVEISDLHSDQITGAGWLMLATSPARPQKEQEAYWRRVPPGVAQQMLAAARIPCFPEVYPVAALRIGLEYRHMIDEIVRLSARLAEATALPTVPLTLLAPFVPEPGAVPEDRTFGPPPSGAWPTCAELGELAAEHRGRWDGDERMDHVLTVRLDDQRQLSVWVSLAANNRAWERESAHQHVRIAPAQPPHPDPLPADLPETHGVVRRRFAVHHLQRTPVAVPAEVFARHPWFEDLPYLRALEHRAADSSRLPIDVFLMLRTIRWNLQNTAYLGGQPIWLQGEHRPDGYLGQFGFQLHCDRLRLGDNGVMYLYSDGAFWQCG